MGSCGSKGKIRHEIDGNHESKKNKKKPNSISEQVDQKTNVEENDKFGNVPFIDGEEKSPKVVRSASSTDEPAEDQTTMKSSFETNVSFTPAETVARLKKEVFDFVREKILPFPIEREKLVSNVLKRIIAGPAEKKIVEQKLDEFLDEIEQNQNEKRDDPIRNRFLQLITVDVSSKSPENSFLKALFDKMGTSLDLSSLNGETTENERVEITVTKRVRKIPLDELDGKFFEKNSSGNETFIEISNSDRTIPNDLPEDIRRKAEQLLNSFNETLRPKPV